MYDFDLIVIGAGSGGVRAARMAASQGKLANGERPKVAIIERGALGGTCVNVGCVPKKLMVYAAHVDEEMKDARDYGWQIEHQDFDWPSFIAKKNHEIARLNSIYGNLLANAGVSIIHGEASLIDAHTVSVAGEQYSADKILLAVGGTPVKPNIPGIEHAIVSDDAFYLPSLPKHMVIVGGGYIALEFACIFNALGSEVHVIYRGSQLLRAFDHDLGKGLLHQAQQQGIVFHLTEQVNHIDKLDDSLSVQLESGDCLQTEQVFYATGRAALAQQLGLDKLGVELSEQGDIVVDDQFNTAVESIYALGDAIGTPALTPVALAQAMVFVDQQYGAGRKTMDYHAIPTAIFTAPNIATVGLSEQQALAQGYTIDLYTSDFKHLKHTLTESSFRVYMKLVVDQQTGIVLGVHMIGPDAGEIIQGLALAVKCQMQKSELDSVIGIHPTAAEEFVTMRQVAYSKP
ncbi:MAG: glutathione-disulfide reductase [Pseudomonadales bacterium]|nr:glutathione-disulfide reductase [Pseudomonadales bacterium]